MELARLIVNGICYLTIKSILPPRVMSKKTIGLDDPGVGWLEAVVVAAMTNNGMVKFFGVDRCSGVTMACETVEREDEDEDEGIKDVGRRDAGDEQVLL